MCGGTQQSCRRFPSLPSPTPTPTPTHTHDGRSLITSLCACNNCYAPPSPNTRRSDDESVVDSDDDGGGEDDEDEEDEDEEEGLSWEELEEEARKCVRRFYFISFHFLSLYFWGGEGGAGVRTSC
jgi:hypothetical protein